MYDSGLGRSRILRGAAAAVGATTVAALVSVLQVGTAQAAVSTVMQANSGAASSAAVQVATAVCPRGTRVFGGGGDIVGGNHSVALTTMKPVSAGAAGDSFSVTATEDGNGYADSWNVYAYAICGTASNLSIQRATLAGGAGDRVQTGASCPAGTAPLGMGAEITGGGGHVVLNALLANYTANSFGQLTGFASAGAFEDQHGFAGSWSLTSYAVCATPLAGLSYRFADSAGGNVPGADKSASVECPAGTRAYASGGYLSYQSGQLHLDRVVPHGAAWTGADLEGRTDTDGFAPGWFTEAEVICAA